MNIKINKKDDVILKILHYFITEEDYKPVIINGIQNEIWLENMEKDLKLIRINTNYIHNSEQFNNDLYKARSIMKSIKRNTLSFNMNMLNLLLDTGETVKVVGTKNVESIKIGKINDFKQNKFVKEFFPSVSKSIFNDKMDPVEFFKLSEDMNQKTIKNEKKLAKIFSPKKPIGSLSLIGINVVAFFVMLILKSFNIDLFYALSNNYVAVQSGEYYRLLSCMFVHADIIHLACNMYALYILGPQVERYYGLKKFLFIYLISGLLGSVFSAVFGVASSFSMGASGAIFGLLGSIAYFSYHYRATLQGFLRSQIIPAIILNLSIGFLFSGIDMAAHIGGLIGGVLTSMSIGIGDKYRKADQINGTIVLILMLLSLIYFIMVK